MKNQSKVTKRLIAATVSLLAFVVAPAYATVISGSETTTQFVAGNENLEVTSTGSVTVEDATDAIAIELDPDYAGTFNNQGSVSATMSAGNWTGDARAVNFLGDILGGDIFNTGGITASATGAAAAPDYAAADAYGFFINGSLTGASSFTNEGAITATATGGSATSAVVDTFADASVTGIYLDNFGYIENNSTLVNSGNITVAATAGTAIVTDEDIGAFAEVYNAYGIHSDEDIRYSSSLSNSGVISVNAQGGQAEAGDENWAYADVSNTGGIYADEIRYNSSLSNSGDITVAATGGTATVGNQVLDNGWVGAYADVDDTYGIETDDIDSGSSFENSGSMNVVAQGGTATSGNASGMGAYAETYADVDDTGGIFVDYIEDGSSMINSGDITVAATGGTATVGNASGDQYFNGSWWESTYADASADVDDTYGIEVDGDLEGGSSFENTGNVDVLAQGGTTSAGDASGESARVNAYADVLDTAGILFDYVEQGSTASNTGDVTVAATGGTATVGNVSGSSANAEAYADADDTFGIEVDGDIEEGSSFENSGSMDVVAQGGTAMVADVSGASAYAYAYADTNDTAGILFDYIEDGSSASNTGNIVVAASGGTASVANVSGSSAYAYVYADAEDAFGIEVDDIEEGSSFENSGSIDVVAQGGTATAGEVSGDNAYAYVRADTNDTAGILFDYIEDGSSASNTGNIVVAATGGTATVANVSGNNAYAYAYADAEDTFGIEVDDIEYGSLLNNSADVSVTATGGTATVGNVVSGASANVYAYADVDDTAGIFMDSYVQYGSSFINSGAVSVTAMAGTASIDGEGSAYAEVDYTYGIVIDSDLEYGSQFNNSGNIGVSATAGTASVGDSGSADAYTDETFGISFDDLIEYGSVAVNSGNVDLSASAGTASAGDNGYADAYTNLSAGIYVDNDIESGSSLDNSGNIDVSATAGSASAGNNGFADAYTSETAGFYVDDNIDDGSLLKNTGVLTVSSQGGQAAAGDNGSADAYADAYGIYVGGNVGGASVLDNRAAISVSAMGGNANAGVGGFADASAYAYGINVGGSVELNSILANSADLSVTATGGRDLVDGGSDRVYAEAYGIYTGTLIGDIDNSASINASATANNPGTDAEAYAYGMYVNNINADGVLNNSGSVNAVAQAGAATNATSEAYGLYVTTLDGVVNNSGSISGSAGQHEDAYSLFVNDPLSSGTVNNLAGGVLSGNLYVDGALEVNNSGTIEIPSVGLGDNAWIAGNYNQDKSGELSVGAYDMDTYGRLVVDSTATFASGTNLHVALAEGNTLVGGNELRDVVVAGTLDATLFNIDDNSALISFDYEIDGNNIHLITQQESAAPMLAAAGFSSGIGAAGVLDQMLAVYATPDAYTDMNGVMASLRSLETEEEVVQAIVTTLPSLNLELSRLSLGNLHNSLRMTRERQSELRGQSSGDGTGKSGKLWVKGFGSLADQKSNNGAFGYDADTQGVVVGGDMDLSNRASIGLGLSYSSSEVEGDINADQSADVNSYQVFLYGDYGLEKEIDLSWHLGFGQHNNEVSRYVPLAGSFAEADFDASSMSAGVAASRDYKTDEKVTLTPSVRLDYAKIDNDSYTETGAGSLNLLVSESDTDELILGVDGERSQKLSQDWQFTANFGLGLDLLADEDSVTAAYAGAPGLAFSTEGTEPSSWLYRGGLGLVYGEADSLQFALRYDLVGRDDYTNQAVSVKLNKMY